MTTRRLDQLTPLTETDEQSIEKLLTQQQDRLTKIQHAYLFNGQRAVIVFEGVDAAGKGGTIRRIAWALDPRSLHVWPIGAPNEVERRQHYLQRFWQRLPEKGQLAVFDRSWYGRVLVERVEAFAKPTDWQRAYSEINTFEQQLTDDGIHVVKLFLHVSKEEQLRRFEARLEDPLKRWKLSYEDFRNREKWDEYIEAIEEMFARTDMPSAPWHVIPSDNKPAARLKALTIIADRLANGQEIEDVPVDPKIIQLAEEYLADKPEKLAKLKKEK